MEFDHAEIPCSATAVESIIRTGTAGLLWGLCSGPFEANQIGLTGSARASFVAKSVGRFGFQCGLFAGIFSVTRCGLERYRSKKDWRNLIKNDKLIIGQHSRAYSRSPSLRWFYLGSPFAAAITDMNTFIAAGLAGVAAGAGTQNRVWQMVSLIYVAGAISEK